jgi:hypothetical protein
VGGVCRVDREAAHLFQRFDETLQRPERR